MRFLLCLLPLLYLSCPEAQSSPAKANPLKIATYEIPSLSSAAPSTPGFFNLAFNKILKEIKSEFKDPVEFKFYPALRTREKFTSKEAFAILPAFAWEFSKSKKDKENYIKSVKIGTKVDILFYNKGLDPKAALAKDNTKIALVRGFPHTPKLIRRFGDKIKFVDNMLAAVKMLKSGRVELLLGDSATTFFAFSNLGIKDIEYSEKLANSRNDAYVYAQNTPKGKAFIKLINEKYLEGGYYQKFLDHIQVSIDRYNKSERD